MTAGHGPPDTLESSERRSHVAVAGRASAAFPEGNRAMGLISVLWGIVAMLLMFVGLIPLLGWLNWFWIPFAGVGALIAALGVLFSASGKNGRAKAGLVLNGIVIAVALVRLSLGGGII